MRFILVTSAVLVLILIIAALIALSRHKKSGSGRIQLLGAEGVVESKLDPEGTVLIDGELWRARSLDGTSIADPARVEVVAVDGHLLLVKRYASTRT
jgi:membrane-bound serine protease (ClpP class)